MPFLEVQMELSEILKKEKEILSKIKELGFLENVKVYDGPKDKLYLIVDYDRRNEHISSTSVSRCLGLQCELTDLLSCQVMIISTSEISNENELEFSSKSALLTDQDGLCKIFETDDLSEIEIDDPNPKYQSNMKDLRYTYERFKSEESQRQHEKPTDKMRTLKIN